MRALIKDIGSPTIIPNHYSFFNGNVLLQSTALFSIKNTKELSNQRLKTLSNLYKTVYGNVWSSTLIWSYSVGSVISRTVI